MSLRILFVTWQGDMAGSTNSIALLTQKLAERGHQIYLGMRKESLLWTLMEDTDVERISMTFKGKRALGNIKQIKAAVRQHQIQIVNAQSGRDRYSTIGAKWFSNLNFKVVHTRRQMPLSHGNPLQLFVYNNGADGVIAVSNQVAQSLAKIGIRKSKIHVIHNGTAQEKYEHLHCENTEKLRVGLQIKRDEFVIGCVSRMKNQIQILQALTKITEPVTLLFCGIEINETFEQIINSLTTAHKVHFLGEISEGQILDYYPLFDVSILASIQEGLSQSLLESMALGIPVIATAAAGNLDLIEDEVNGLLFENQHIDQLARNINSIRHNPILKDKLIKKGKETALVKFNIKNTIDHYEEYFNSLV